jgi:phosphatidylserine decarboxylase
MVSREGFGIIATLAFFAAFLGLLGYFRDNTLIIILAGITAVMFLFAIYFFRDPRRMPPVSSNVIVSPSDGTVIEVVECEEKEYIEGSVTRVSIFLSLFNVHVNYVPFSGTVDFLKYERGKFFRANTEDAFEKNAHTLIGLKTKHGKLVFRQSVGLVARRIVCHLRYGDNVKTGKKFGIMKFGSRMDVYFPAWATVTVKVGEKLIGAESIIGEVVESK